MKTLKYAIAAASMMTALSAAVPASAQFGGEYTSDNWSRYYTEVMRPMIAKMPAAEAKKVMDMEMSIAKMESEHRATMMKMESDHKMSVLKMRQELELALYRGGAR